MKYVHISHINGERGFFSEFSTILSGIKYCSDNNYNFYVTWYNNLYHNTTENLFDKYFFQEPILHEPFEIVYNILTPVGQKFSDDIMKCYKNDLELSKTLEIYSDLIKKYKIIDSSWINNINKNYFGDTKVLGVHKRGTDHVAHGEILSDEYFFEKIDNEIKLNGYEKIFLITDDEISFKNFSNKYGHKLIYTDSTRTLSKSGLHFTFQENKDKLASDVIRDVILLSQTNKKLVTHSNVSYFSILFNFDPQNYEFIDKHIKYH
jgi:hypothetical protein